MTPEHVAVLKSYSIHITRHRAGTYSGDMKHRPDHNMYTHNKLCHKHVPGTSIHFTRTLRGMLQACVAGTCSGYKITLFESQIIIAEHECCTNWGDCKSNKSNQIKSNQMLVHLSTAAGTRINFAQQGQHQIAHIHSQLQPLHVPGT